MASISRRKSAMGGASGRGRSWYAKIRGTEGVGEVPRGVSNRRRVECGRRLRLHGDVSERTCLGRAAAPPSIGPDHPCRWYPAPTSASGSHVRRNPAAPGFLFHACCFHLLQYFCPVSHLASDRLCFAPYSSSWLHTFRRTGRGAGVRVSAQSASG